MLRDVSYLKEAYDFYKKAKKDKNAVLCGSLKNAQDWIIAELDDLFADEDDEDED